MGKFILNKSFKGTFFDLGVGSTTLVAGDMDAGFFGEVSQGDFEITMTQVMSDLDITGGIAQNTSEPLLKFIHDGKIKYINKKTIRYNITWDHIASKINVYSGTTMTFGGNSYKVRLMRGWGQVSANVNGTGTPNFETGPLYTVNFSGGTGGDSGVNWPNDNSDWSANNPNEWNTLMFPIHVDSGNQTQTGNVPNWDNYSDSDLMIGSGNGRATYTQETFNTSTDRNVTRGKDDLAYVDSESGANSSTGLRLVFELIQ